MDRLTEPRQRQLETGTRRYLFYEVNIKAEMEIAHLREKTDRIHESMLERFAKLEKLIA